MDFEKIIAVRTDKTVYRDGNDCIKVFKESYPKDEVINEALNQARIETTGIDVPAVKGIVSVGGKWAIISDFIEGKTLSALMAENPNKKDEYLEKFVDLQIEIFSKKCPLLNRQKDKMRNNLLACELKATTRYDLLRKLETLPKHDKICHGNYCPENVIIGNDGKSYVIDWACATQGNASADVARTYLLFWLNGDISGAKKYLELFCEKSGTEKCYFEKWLPIVAASRYLKGNVNEREFLRSWIEREYE